MSYDPDHLKDDLAQFYLVVDLVLELLTGHRHKPPRICIEFLAEGGFKPRHHEKTWPTLIIDLKKNIPGNSTDFMKIFDKKVAEHVMRARRPDRLAFYVQEPEARRGERDPKAYWMIANKTVGAFPIQRAMSHTKPQYSDRGRWEESI